MQASVTTAAVAAETEAMKNSDSDTNTEDIHQPATVW